MTISKHTEHHKAHELWLYKNPQALKDVQEGLQQSKENRVRKRGSFAKYAQDDT
jgi:hypothetical protein